MTKKVLKYSVSILCCLLLISFVCFQTKLIAENKTIENQFFQVGSSLQEKPGAYKESLEIVQGKKELSDTEIIAWVNNIPIAKVEFDLRKALRDKSGAEIQDNSGVFNILIEEKIVFAEAQKRGLMPTEKETEAVIERQKQDYNNIPKYKEVVDSFCKSSNMSIEDYWNIYTRYNEYRVLVLQKVYDNEIENAISKGLLDTQKDTKTFSDINKDKEFWKKVKLEMKNKADIKMNPAFSNMNLTIDLNNLSSISK